jgi:quercetin dioxygenase-like cupin family protein
MSMTRITDVLGNLPKRIGDAMDFNNPGRPARALLIAALALVAMSGFSSAAGLPDEASIDKSHDTIIFPRFPDDRPAGPGALVTAVSRKRVLNVHDASLSTFIVDYAPGGSAVIPRSTAYGYVLMQVLSGSIKATAWEAGVGTYQEGQTWVFPAYGNKIVTKNTSTGEAAKALLVLITGDALPAKPQQNSSDTPSDEEMQAGAMPAAADRTPVN